MEEDQNPQSNNEEPQTEENMQSNNIQNGNNQNNDSEQVENDNEQNENENAENDEEEDNKLMYIYEWVDSIPLSRQKKNISRDFNDAVLLAEMIKYHYPRLVELHNYPNASSTKHKLENWITLNNKVLKKLGIKLTKDEMMEIVSSKPNAIENLLARIYGVIHGLPQENKENIDSKMQNNIQDKNNALKEAILIKDQEIADLKEIIEGLEKKLNESNERQNELEKRVKELNDIAIQNDID